MDKSILYLLLYVLGLGLFFLELFVPSGGVLGIGATLCIVYSLWELNQISPWITWICVVFTAVYLFVLVRWGIRRVLMNASLRGVATGSDVMQAATMIGTVGVTASILRPAGVAVFNGQKFDVVTRGDFIEAGCEVEVVETSGNRIIVQAHPGKPD